MNNKNEVVVYTYGRRHEFSSMKRAKEVVLEWMIGSEGCEKERYTDVYIKLCAGETLACDCDGVPSPNRKKKPLSEEEKKLLAMLKVLNAERSKVLDAMRKELDEKKAELLKQLEPMQKKVDSLAWKWNDTALKIISLEKRM